GDVMTGGNDAGGNQPAHEIANLPFMLKVYRRRRAFAAPVDVAQIDRLTQMRTPERGGPEKQYGLVFGSKADARHPAPVFQKTDAANGGRRQDRLAVRLVVQRDIAGHDREVECA